MSRNHANDKRLVPAEQRDARVIELYDQLIEIEQRLIPTGLHILGRPSESSERADMLRMIASFDRPEAGVRALPDLVCESLGLGKYEEILRSAARDKAFRSKQERIDTIVSESTSEFVNNGSDAAVKFLATNANVPSDKSGPVFAMLEGISQQLETNN